MNDHRANDLHKKNKWQLIWKFFTNFYTILTAFVGITGLTIFKLLPNEELEIINPNDPSSLVLELKNNSFFSMRRIRPVLYIDEIKTMEGDSIKRKQIHYGNVDRLSLDYNQSYALNYNFNAFLFYYNHPPQFFKANIAVVLEYEFLWKKLKSVYFYECIPELYGKFLWVKAPDQNFVDEMDKDTSQATLYGLPLPPLNPEKFIKDPPPPPKSVLN